MDRFLHYPIKRWPKWTHVWNWRHCRLERLFLQGVCGSEGSFMCTYIDIYIYTYLIYICIYKYQICMGCGKQDGGMLTALLRCYTEFYENKLSTYFRLTPLLWSFSSWMPMGCDYSLAMFRDGDKFAFSCWTEPSSQHQSQIHEYRLS